MKPSVVSLFMLALLILLTTRPAAGIRMLERKSKISPRNKLQEKSVVGQGGGSVAREDCGPLGHCSGTSGRELVNTVKSSVESKSNEGTVVDSARGSQHQSKRDVGSRQEDLLHVQQPPPTTASSPPQTYPDVMDIAGMDYSPAKRKPPIHN